MRNVAIPSFYESNRRLATPKTSFLVNCGKLLRWTILAILPLMVAAVGARIAAAQETVLWSFQQNHIDGTSPNGGLVMDSAGNLYGATSTGGANDAGIVFELSPKAGGGGGRKRSFMTHSPAPAKLQGLGG